MRMTRARAAGLLFGGVALAGVRFRGAAQTTAKLRVAIVPIEGASEVYFATDMGFFAKAGLDVEIQPMQSSPAIAAAVASNAVDIGFISVDALATIYQKNIPLTIIAPSTEYTAATSHSVAIALAASSPIRVAKDLDGKTIAVNALHSLSTLGPSDWIDQNGGDSSTVKFVEMPFPIMTSALDAGRVDAALVTEPFTSAARKNGRIIASGFDYIAKHFLITSWCTTEQWAKEHPDVVARFAAVIHQTAVWANANRDRSGEILVKYTKMDPAVLATISRSQYCEQLTPALLQPLIDVSAKYNGFTTFPAQDLIYVPRKTPSPSEN